MDATGQAAAGLWEHETLNTIFTTGKNSEKYTNDKKKSKCQAVS